MTEPRWGQETVDSPIGPQGAEWERLQLVVVQEASSLVVPLRPGPFTIGRAPEANLIIDDPSISRLHTRLLVTDTRVVLSDLGSRNGTLLNGVAVTEPRTVAPGDVIGMGTVTLVVQGQRARGEDRLLALPQLRERLAEELTRSTHYERPLSVAAISLGREGFTTARLTAVKQALRAHDRLALDSASVVVLLLPELAEQEARQLVDEVLQKLKVEGASAGISVFPADGLDGEALLLAAREAASGLGVKYARELVTRVPLGDRTLLIADPAMRGLHQLILRLAPSDLPVLLSGETGTGKELAAMSLHAHSPRRDKPFIAVNCAALPESLAESELFGHERGAFSGATASKQGFFEAADGGTLFLDEVGDLPLPLQAKLLRAAESKQITRLGDTRTLRVDVRLVAATHRDLQAEVKAGRFREDLYFRLAAARVVLPPLRSRPREIPLLAQSFLEEACQKLGRPAPILGASALAQLSAHPWPGNVRELRNVISALAATHEGSRVDDLSLAADAPPPPPPPATPRKAFTPIGEELRALERTRMIEALEACGGVQKYAAQLIGMPLRTFVLKARQYDLQGRGGR